MKNYKKIKKIAVFLSFFAIFCTFFDIFSKNTQISNAQNQEYYFAKIEAENLNFYSSPSITSAKFQLPKSYFVKLTDSTNTDFYTAEYQDETGYVLKSDFKAQTGTPNTPYLYKTISLYYQFELKQSPQISSQTITTLSTSSSIYYIGKISGQSISTNSSTWFYVSTTLDSGEYVKGYAYSLLFNSFSYEQNTESFDYVSYDIFSSASKAQNTTSASLSTVAKVFIIFGITIPTILILYLLIKPIKITEASKRVKHKSAQTKLKKRHSQDYFEFDEKML